MRSKITEQRYIYGLLDSSETVTISVVDVSGDAVAVDSDSCVELVARGDGKSIYQWDTQNITTFPAAYTEIVWLMTDGTNYAQGSVLFGGYPDSNSTLTPAQVNEQADLALTDYGAATGTELAAVQSHGDSNWLTADISGVATSAVQSQILKALINTKFLDDVNYKVVIYDDDGTTPLFEFYTKNADGDLATESIKKFEKI